VLETLAPILHLYLQAFYSLKMIFILTISLLLYQSMYYILSQHYGAKIENMACNWFKCEINIQYCSDRLCDCYSVTLEVLGELILPYLQSILG
jgi:hypothetical protein